MAFNLQGAGTAIGELPPYFMARAARLSGNIDEEEQELEELMEEQRNAEHLVCVAASVSCNAEHLVCVTVSVPLCHSVMLSIWSVLQPLYLSVSLFLPAIS